MNTLRKSIENEKITPYFVSWSQLEQEISLLFGNKTGNTEAKMKEGISLYKALLAQCSTEEERLEPLNNAERLKFIEENFATYAAFRQLQELFKEMQKKIASKRVILGKP
ncbi:YpoC family protein [Planococcus sp. CAU13]|uniref:YpoC family protein n=1 Tax=Planococcus sp. CAU13 TaxID=1541197 RepID=UPI00068E003C|nr:hypothetical protein [Planococcus sp. CAU13]